MAKIDIVLEKELWHIYKKISILSTLYHVVPKEDDIFVNG